MRGARAGFVSVLCSLAAAGPAAAAGGVFVTGHDPDYHAQNSVGAQHIIQRAVAYVTANKTAPRLLLVTDLQPCGGCYDPRLGMQASGFTTFDVADYGSATSGVLDLHTVRFSNYDAVVVASDFGGWLRQAELDILNARSNDLLSYVNGGGGLIAFAESGAAGTTSHDRFKFLPFLVGSTLFNQVESGNTLTAAGVAMGLTTSDVNGNYSHNIFTALGGLDIIDIDPSRDTLSAATKQQVVATGVNYPPVARLTADVTSGRQPLVVHFDGSASSDPDNDLASWSLSFGDGSASLSGTGTPPASSAHTYTAAGTPSATLTVTDAGGLTSTARVDLTVTQAQTVMTAKPVAAEVLPGAGLTLPYLTATLARVAPSGPVAGRRVTFTSGSTSLCTATTVADGTATCQDVLATVGAAAGLGYTASFAGDDQYLASTARAGIARVNGQDTP